MESALITSSISVIISLIALLGSMYWQRRQTKVSENKADRDDLDQTARRIANETKVLMDNLREELEDSRRETARMSLKVEILQTEVISLKAREIILSQQNESKDLRILDMTRQMGEMNARLGQKDQQIDELKRITQELQKEQH